MTKGDTPDFRERMRQLFESLGEEIDRVGSGDVATIVESANHALASAMAWWAENASVRRFIGGVQRDILTGAGEPVDLAAQLGIVSKIGTTARFLVDGTEAAEAPIGDDLVVRARLPTPAPGLHRIGLCICDAKGRVLSEVLDDRILQVASGRPLALVDAELVLRSEHKHKEDFMRMALEAIAHSGFEIAYFDVHEKNRALEISEVIESQGLPLAAVLAHAAEEENLKDLGLDFVRMFGLTAVRRLRARGVPVTMMVTKFPTDPALQDSEEVHVLTPEEAIAHVEGEGIARQNQQADLYLRSRAAVEPAAWRLTQATRSALVSGNSLKAELDNERAREALFKAIDSAQESIHIQFYIVRSSAFTDALIVRLIQRARAGVRVRFMVDALYSDEQFLGRRNPVLLSLRDEPSVEVLASSPIDKPQELGFESLKKRDHRKVVVIDGRHAIVSGRNASDEYFTGFREVPIHDNTPHERIPWLDAHVEVRGPLVHEIQETFVEAWVGQGGEPITEDSTFPELASEGTAAARLVVHHGFEDANGLAMYEEMLDLAQSHVYIVNDFPIVSTLEEAIYRLLARGVEVTLLTGNASARRDDGTFFPGPLHRAAFEFMVKAKLEPLLKAGVRVYEFVPPASENVVARGGRIRPYVHAKVVSVDGLLTSVGSANLDVTASFWESEANVVVHDEVFARSVEDAIRGFLQSSVELDLDSEYWKQERAQRAVVGTLWPGAVYS